MNKDIKTFQEWKEDRATEEAIAGGYLTVMLIAIIFLAALASCSTQRIAHTPSKREVRKAMQHSDWRFGARKVRSNLGVVWLQRD